jgi:hypothetical protein
MKQRKLRLDDLRVETFEISREQGGRGTVHAHQESGECTPVCSVDVETCAHNCTFSLPEHRMCVETWGLQCSWGPC